MAAPPAECIELDDSSDDDSSVLEIVTAPKKPPPPAAAAAGSDSDDDSLFQGEPVFSTNVAADASRISNNKEQDANPKRKLTREERQEERRLGKRATSRAKTS